MGGLTNHLEKRDSITDQCKKKEEERQNEEKKSQLSFFFFWFNKNLVRTFATFNRLGKKKKKTWRAAEKTNLKKNNKKLTNFLNSINSSQ